MESQYESSSRPPGTICDITDGTVYKSIRKKSIYDINLIQNTDGFPFAGSNNKQIWPNFLTIAEVKPNLRSNYMILAGFWFSPAKANLYKFLTPFCMEMRKLSIDGFTWTHPSTHETVKSHVNIIATTLDAQARAPALSMSFYNAPYGCSFCDTPGGEAPLAKAPVRGEKNCSCLPLSV